MPPYLPGLESGRLEKRIEFLTSRAQAHLNARAEELPHRACAATLLRDAACVALLIDQVGRAREFLHQAGHHFLTLGLPYGALLVALTGADSARWEVSEYNDVMEGTRRQWSREQAREGDRFRRPMADTARSSPRQMISLMQADLLMEEVGAPSPYREHVEMRVALERSSGHPVGTTGLSIGTYLRITEWISEQRKLEWPRSRHEDMPRFVEQGFTTISAMRTERIQAAMKDSYHWRLLARPAELIDLDTVALASLALRSGMDIGNLHEGFSAEDTLVSAPILAARGLQEGDRER